MKDTYNTIVSASEEVLFKDRNSKFFGYAFPVISEDEIKTCIEKLKKQHHSARHWCYAWQLGTEKTRFRANDDGEPNNSAGMPIYGQIQAYGVTNILIVVVRYFGGTKLGVGGLINAYREAAKLAMETSDIVECTIDKVYTLHFDYKYMNTVMRLIKEKQLKVRSQKLEMDCTIEISVRKKDADMTRDTFDAIFGVQILPLND